MDLAETNRLRNALALEKEAAAHREIQLADSIRHNEELQGRVDDLEFQIGLFSDEGESARSAQLEEEKRILKTQVAFLKR